MWVVDPEVLVAVEGTAVRYDSATTPHKPVELVLAGGRSRAVVEVWSKPKFGGLTRLEVGPPVAEGERRGFCTAGFESHPKPGEKVAGEVP